MQAFSPEAVEGRNTRRVRTSRGIERVGGCVNAPHRRPGHSWLSRYGGLLVGWAKKVANYKALLFLACAHVVWPRSIVFG